MTIELNIAERLVSLAVFNNPENKVATEHLKIYLEDVHKFRIDDKEKEEIAWEELKNEEGQITSYKWNNPGYTKEIDIDSFTHTFLKEKITALEYSAADPLAGAVASVLEKLQ